MCVGGKAMEREDNGRTRLRPAGIPSNGRLAVSQRPTIHGARAFVHSRACACTPLGTQLLGMLQKIFGCRNGDFRDNLQICVLNIESIVFVAKSICTPERPHRIFHPPPESPYATSHLKCLHVISGLGIAATGPLAKVPSE